MENQNSITTVVDYKFFNVLNPAYSVCQYAEIQRGQRFRYNGEWRIKVGSKFAMTKDKIIGISYISIEPDRFVLFFKYEPLHMV